MKVMAWLLLLFFSANTWCQTLNSSGQKEENRFDLQSLPISEVISLYFKGVETRPYVLCDSILQDKRSVSIRATGKYLNTAIFHAVLKANGYEATDENGVVVICSNSAKEKESLGNDKTEPFIYTPKYRNTQYLVELLQPLVKGHFANKRSPVAAATAVGGGTLEQGNGISKSYNSANDDYIVFSGEQEAVERLKSLLSQIDVPTPSVLVRAFVFEVSKSIEKSSALKLVANLLSGHLGIKIGVKQLTNGNSISIESSSLDVVASALSSDSRFKLITAPFVRARTNEPVRLQVGQDVPVAGQILMNPNGQTTQSTEYHSSGVILQLTASVREQSIDLDLLQTVSSFTKTDFADTSNPTLNKRELKTSLSVGDGELVLLGGLSDKKSENTDSGLFGWNFAKSESDFNNEIVLLLQVERI